MLWLAAAAGPPFAASLASWAGLATIGMFWHPLYATSAITCLLAMAVGCFANAFKNRTYHCVLTGVAISDSGDSVTLVGFDAQQACFRPGIRSRWDRNRVLPGVALFPEDIGDYYLQFLSASSLLLDGLSEWGRKSLLEKYLTDRYC
jgi:hypothetical protein